MANDNIERGAGRRGTRDVVPGTAGNGVPGGSRAVTERLRLLQRLQATRRQRELELRRPGLRVPLVVGSALLLLLAGLTLFGILTTFQATAAIYAALTTNLPSVSAINEHTTFKTAQVFDRNGELLWEFYDQEGGLRTVIPLREVSQHLIDATLAAEDAYFYQHRGFDPRATLRSALQTYGGGERSGASTLTQQLVRATIMDPEEAQQVTPTRKLREIILAYRLSQKLSKDQILEMYLNEVYYGNLSYGIEAASQRYFDKHARDLTLPEAALLAGLVQSPSAYDPSRKDLPRTADGIPVVTKARQAYVLEQMTRHGFITEAQALEAYNAPLKIITRQVDLKSPHWVMYIRELVEQKYGPKMLYQGGLKIYTTLDHAYNERMLEVLRNSRPNIEALGGNNAAMVAVNPKTGEILAFNGSMDYDNDEIDGQVNVLLSERQPGSSIKPVIYAASFEKGWAPGTFVNDVPTCWQDRPGNQWCPVNFDNTFHGQTTLRSALGNSLNIPAVKTLEYTGIDSAVDLGRGMGITTWSPDSGKHFGLSLTLGGAEVRPLDLAQVYTTLANNGLRIPLVAITRVVDAEGNVLEDYKVPQGEQVLEPRAAYMTTDVLADPKAKLFTYGRNTPLVLERPSASKTGTTDNYRDTWTAGYTPNLAVVVWVGNSDGRPMRQVLSSMTAGKIWPEAMTASFEHLQLPVEEFVRPAGLVERQVCGDMRMRPGEPACRNDLFYEERAGNAPAPAPANVRPGASAPAPAPALAPRQVAPAAVTPRQPAPEASRPAPERAAQPAQGDVEPAAQPAQDSPAPAAPAAEASPPANMGAVAPGSSPPTSAPQPKPQAAAPQPKPEAATPKPEAAPTPEAAPVAKPEAAPKPEAAAAPKPEAPAPAPTPAG